MENKTAMQELLEWVRKTLPMDLDTPRMIEDKIESLLPVEKDQIMYAYHDGQDNIDSDGCLIDDISAEQYYSETYGK
jgi:hypothetical protein